MSSDKRTESFKAPPEVSDGIRRYQKSRGFEHRSQAHQELVEVGLREQRNPIIWRLKDKVVDWASMLAIAAIVMGVVGATTDIVGVYDGAAISLTLLITASVLLAVFEFTRIVMGMNAVGVKTREVIGKVIPHE